MGTRTAKPIDISLPDLLGCRGRVSQASRKEVEALFSDRAEIWVDAQEVERLAPSVTEADDWALAGSEARSRQDAAVELLRQAGRAGRSVTFNAVWRERQGGRRYAFHVPDYNGPLVLSQKCHAALGHRVLLQAVPRIIRPAVCPPPGHVFVSADIDRCFLAIAAALTGDEQLRRDLAGDVHQAVGDMLAEGAGKERRRSLGKLVNNALVGGQTSHGLLDTLRAGRAKTSSGGTPHPDDARRVWRAWWDRYPRFNAFVDGLRAELRHRAADNLGFRIEAPDGRVFGFSPAEVRGWKNGVPPTDERQGIEAAARSITSSIFRCVEGCVIDRALQVMQPHRGALGLRLALPMYDGMLMAVPTQNPGADALVRESLLQALVDVGVSAGVEVVVQQRWGPPTRRAAG